MVLKGCKLNGQTCPNCGKIHKDVTGGKHWAHGHTKYDHPGIARRSKKIEEHTPWNKGKTKENDERVARIAAKRTGRTKENDGGVRRAAEKMTGRTKENDEGIRRGAGKRSGEKHYGFGKPVWNSKLTKYDHPSIASQAAYIRANNPMKNSVHKATHLKVVKSPEHVRKLLSSLYEKPNNFEQACGQLLKQLYPDEFDYCGNGTVVINGHPPDYVSNRRKIVVLCNGIYWHLQQHGMPVTPGNKKFIEALESYSYIEDGYEVWFIWEDEMKIRRGAES